MKPEYKIILNMIDENSRVLDVGCDDGTLMDFLKESKNVDIRGIEISKEKVQTCISKGLTVIEGNAEFDLKQFPNKSFDYVVLGQTLQAFINPEIVIIEDSRPVSTFAPDVSWMYLMVEPPEPMTLFTELPPST